MVVDHVAAVPIQVTARLLIFHLGSDLVGSTEEGPAGLWATGVLCHPQRQLCSTQLLRMSLHSNGNETCWLRRLRVSRKVLKLYRSVLASLNKHLLKSRVVC